MNTTQIKLSQSAFVRGFIDDRPRLPRHPQGRESQSAFVRGFIDDSMAGFRRHSSAGLNPRSCAASSMTYVPTEAGLPIMEVSIRVRARLHR